MTERERNLRKANFKKSQRILIGSEPRISDAVTSENFLGILSRTRMKSSEQRRKTIVNYRSATVASNENIRRFIQTKAVSRLM